MILLTIVIFHQPIQAEDDLQPSSGGDYFVSTDGNDSWSGRKAVFDPKTQDGPFRTIQKAVELLEPGDTLLIREGVYREQIDLSNLNGTSDRPIRIQSYPGENVTISGTRILDKSWESTGNDTFKTMVNKDVSMLFLDERLMLEARWPNVEWNFIEHGNVWPFLQKQGWRRMADGSVYGRIVDPELKEIEGRLSEGRVNLNRTWLFWKNIPLNRQADREKLIYKKVLGRWVEETWRAGASWTDTHYFIKGNRSLLDNTGEYYYDASEETLYVNGPDGWTPDDHQVQIHQRNFSLVGKNLQHVTISGLQFFATSIRLKNARQVAVHNTHLQYQPEPLRMNGRNNHISSGSAGFALESVLRVEGNFNLVENMVFHDIYSSDGNHAIRISPGTEGNEVRNSTLFNGGEGMVRLKRAKNTRVHRNHVYRTGLLRGECSPVIAGHPNGSGAEFSNNWVHRTETWGKGNAIALRADDQSRAVSIHHNVVWNNGHGIVAKGDGHDIYNNTAFSNYAVDIVVPQRPEPKKFFNQAPLLERQNRNTCVYNNAAASFGEWAFRPLKPPGGTHSNNFSRPDFELRNATDFDFRPSAGSPLINRGRPTDVTRPYSGSAPDIGAYEHGEPRWIPGATNSLSIRFISREANKLTFAVRLHMPPLEKTRLSIDTRRKQNRVHISDGPVAFTRLNWKRPRKVVVRSSGPIEETESIQFASRVLGRTSMPVQNLLEARTPVAAQFHRPMLHKRIEDFQNNGLIVHRNDLFSIPTDKPLNVTLKDASQQLQNHLFDEGKQNHVPGWTFHPGGAPDQTAHGLATRSERDGVIYIKVPENDKNRFWPQWRQTVEISEIGLKPGDDVIVNLWMKTRQLQGRDNKWSGGRAALHFFNRDGDRLKKITGLPALKETNDWTPQILRGTVPENTDRISVRLMSSSAHGKVWFDRVEVQSVAYRKWEQIVNRW